MPIEQGDGISCGFADLADIIATRIAHTDVFEQQIRVPQDDGDVIFERVLELNVVGHAIYLSDLSTAASDSRTTSVTCHGVLEENSCRRARSTGPRMVLHKLLYIRGKFFERQIGLEVVAGCAEL